MNELEREFINQSSADLKNILRKSDETDAQNFPEKFLPEIFRTLHTIKGTAQTFGFKQSAELAHSLENLVSNAKNEGVFAADFSLFLREGIALLIESFEREDFQIPNSFAEKISYFQTDEPAEDFSENHLSEIPDEILASLSEPEKIALCSAIKSGKNIFVVEIGFDLATFAVEFKDFRQRLSEKGEIIASLPCPKFTAQKKIGFQIVCASKENLADFADKNAAKIIFELRSYPADSVQAVLAKIIGHGKDSAKMLGKNIEFDVYADDFQVSPKYLKLIFDLLLHLVRNAVSHAISEKGRVTIDLKTIENRLILTVSDNGKGLNIEKIRAKAVEKNLPIDAEDEIIHYIFLPEFSTAENLTKISGRGIGLDAVKNLTETAGGKINVNSNADQGASFEIELPLQTAH